MITINNFLDTISEKGGTIISTSGLTNEEIESAQSEHRVFFDKGGLGFVWEPKINYQTKCQQKNIHKGFFVQKGSDGHWLSFSADGKHATINIENTFSRPGIVRSAILAWVDEVFSS